jgi:uncharacterized protein
MKARPHRVVLDTNVLISAALSARSLPASVVDYFFRFGQVVFSKATFDEFESRLWRPKFDKYLPIETRRGIILEARGSAQWVDLVQHSTSDSYSRDPDDDKFIHTALAGKADALISGDQDLLILGEVNGLTILSPAAVLAVLG